MLDSPWNLLIIMIVAGFRVTQDTSMNNSTEDTSMNNSTQETSMNNSTQDTSMNNSTQDHPEKLRTRHANEIISHNTHQRIIFI